MIAINLCDLDAITPRTGLNTTALLLRDYFNEHSPTVDVTSRWDTSAVILDGPAAQDPKRVNAVITLLQTVIGPRRINRRVRCYEQGPRGGWKEIRHDK